MNFVEISKKILSYRTLPAAASDKVLVVFSIKHSLSCNGGNYC